MPKKLSHEEASEITPAYDLSRTGYFYIVWMPDLDLTGFGVSDDPDDLAQLAAQVKDNTKAFFDVVFTGTGQEVAMFGAELRVLVREMGEVDMSRPAGFKRESLAGDWCMTLCDLAERAGLTAIA